MSVLKRSTSIFFLLLFLGSVHVASAQSWEKVWVTNRDDGLTGTLLNPSIAIDGNGRFRLLFAESDGVDAGSDPATFNVSFRYADNLSGDGTKFAPSISVASGSATLYSSFALDADGHGHAVIADDNGGGFACLRHAAETAGVWSLDDPMACNPRQAFPAMGIDREGTIHVAYEDGESIYYRQRDPDGTWSVPVDISNNLGRDGTPSIAVAPDGAVHVLFYRWNSTTRRTLMYTRAAAGGTAFSLPEPLRVMSGSNEEVELPFLAPPFVPSIALDRLGICHVVFTSVFGVSSDLNQILYMNNAGGTWSDPVAISGIGFYNRASITAADDGGLHVAAEWHDAEGNDWDIVYIRKAAGGWEPEQDLTANDVDDFASANGGRFIEARGRNLAIVYQTLEPNPDETGSTPGNEIALLRQEITLHPTLVFSGNPIDFDTVNVGECRDTILVIANPGSEGITAAAAPSLQENTPHFSLIGADPFALASGESDTIRIRFCPQGDGCFSDRIRIAADAGEYEIILNGCGRGPRLSVAPKTLDFDTLVVEDCRDTTLIITNSGGGVLTSLSIPEIENNSPHFSLIGADPFALASGESDTIRIRFCPQGNGCFDDRVRITTDTEERFIQLHGCGQRSIPRILRLDTVRGHVGERLTLTAQLQPAPTEAERIDGFTIRIAYDSRAIYPHRILEGKGVTMSREEENMLVLKGDPGTLLLDPILFRLEIEGLVTGNPENPMRIEEGKLEGAAGTVETHDGLVRLEGCDIGTGLGFGRAVRIGGITPFPFRDEVSLIWQAPEGYAPTLRIIDAQGKVVRRETLPEGRGEEQRIPLKREDLPPGWYVIELIDRAEHHSIPILITE